MRRVFGRMEAWDRDKIRETPGLSPLDSRLRQVRENALIRHRRALAAAGGGLGPELFFLLYRAAFEEELQAMGLPGGCPAENGPLELTPELLSALKDQVR
jgi:hypothetical protein